MAEHEQIVAAEKNTERRLFYELLWEIGAAQSDTADLRADDIDWPERRLSYHRRKTGTCAELTIGPTLEGILKQLPSKGPLFPTLCNRSSNDRAAEFYRRCKNLQIPGVSLHSYRFAWARRAREAGYPERFAQEALGHASKAIHRAYTRGARSVLPSLEDFQAENLGVFTLGVAP